MGIKSRLYKYYFPEFIASTRFNHLSKDSGILLMYHEVLPDDICFPSWTVVKATDFQWQMGYLQRHFDVVSIDDGIERVKGQRKSKKSFAVVTFDDGYAGNLFHVLPIMKSFGLPYTVYVATGAVTGECVFWFDRILNLLGLQEDIYVELQWNEQLERFFLPGKAAETTRWQAVHFLLERLKQMPADIRESQVLRITRMFSEIKPVLKTLKPEDLKKLGSCDLVTIGSHTHGHELLDEIDDSNIHSTLKNSKEYIIRNLNKSPKHFAYPNGNYNRLIATHVREMGFETAVTTKSGIWSPASDLMELPRLGIGRFETKGRFKALLSGFLP